MSKLVTFALVILSWLAGRQRGRADMIAIAQAPSQRALAAGRAGRASIPGPLATLVGFMKADRVPPPVVVQHAIAEASLLGRHDLARDLAQTFPLPPGAITPPDPRTANLERERESMRAYDREREQTAHHDERHDERHEDRREDRREERIERELAELRAAQAAQAAPPPPPSSSPGLSFVTPQDAPLPSDFDPSAYGMPDDGGDTAVSGVLHAPVSAPASSPLPGISPDAWSAYRQALEREPATFDSARRVGRYALRKDRLRELGCNPDVLTTHPRATELQDAALAIDAVDSAKHLRDSGTLDAHIGRAIALPGEDSPRRVTLSGLLGVAQVAGLEGCIGWLENPGDRKRFPHTTKMFQRANGVF